LILDYVLIFSQRRLEQFHLAVKTLPLLINLIAVEILFDAETKKILYPFFLAVTKMQKNTKRL